MTFAKYQCPGCGHVYDEERGNPREGFPPGTRWEAIPDDGLPRYPERYAP